MGEFNNNNNNNNISSKKYVNLNYIFFHIPVLILPI